VTINREDSLELSSFQSATVVRMRIAIPHKRSMKMTAQPNAVPPIPEGSSTVMPWIISRDTAKL
jgi:hypothetical protein